MIVLYGSHARGDWTYDKYKEDWITYEYVSDYDVLIITDNDSGLHKNHAVWDEVRDRFAFGRPREGERSAGLSLIVHNLHEVNKALEENRYFFADIQREGLLLNDSGQVELAARREPTAEERRERAKEEMTTWLAKAKDNYDVYEFAIANNKLLKAAFELHQATENLYATVSLVFTDYRPKLHDLYKLRDRIAELDRRTLTAFPRKTKDEKRLFKLLADAYVHARYTKTYSITREELEYLAERVQKLRGIVEEVCRERIGA
jgi:predicted nucleotidyltransferase/HEPN domain-containing protein